MAKKAVVLFLVLCVTACFAAERKQDEGAEAVHEEEKIQLPAKDSPTYWIVRSQALDELTPLLTKERSEARKQSKLLTDYLVSIEKADDFATSGIKATPSPKLYAEALGRTEEFIEADIPLSEKPLTWGQTVEFAMKHVLREGYLPTDIDGEEELQMYKDICQQKGKYGIKVRNELRAVAQECMDMWLYLEKSEQQAGYKVYVFKTKKQEREAREAKRQKLREERKARMKEHLEIRRRNALQNRQRLLRLRYRRYYW